MCSASKEARKKPGGSITWTADLNERAKGNIPHHRTPFPIYRWEGVNWELPITAGA